MTTTTMTATTMTSPADAARALASQFISFLETGQAPDALFTEDAFCDLTVPLWRLQGQGRSAVIALRTDNHPGGGTVSTSRFDVTERGFLLEVEERWEDRDESWYCRELIRCDVTAGAISAIAVYCTGDWDSARVTEHAAAVPLLRP